MKIILASNSPRRRDILTENNIQFDIIPSTKDEIKNNGLSPEEYTKLLSFNKAKDVFDKNKGRIVLGADTIVVFNNIILGKPKNEEDAINTLKMLSGNTHKVITGWTVISPLGYTTKSTTSLVTFNTLSEEIISEYIASGLYKGKAGSYGIQDGFPLVKQFIGDYDNIVGLPINDIKGVLEEYESKNSN